MIGRYQLHNEEWYLKVDGKVKSGDVVLVPRPRGGVHRQKVDQVVMVARRLRLCTILPVTRDRLEEVYGKKSLSPSAIQGSARLR
jgi:hypothetical protein